MLLIHRQKLLLSQFPHKFSRSFHTQSPYKKYPYEQEKAYLEMLISQHIILDSSNPRTTKTSSKNTNNGQSNMSRLSQRKRLLTSTINYLAVQTHKVRKISRAFYNGQVIQR